jgi:outer membrane protein OmpA-like peptidoglycan-associated protein
VKFALVCLTGSALLLGACAPAHLMQSPPPLMMVRQPVPSHTYFVPTPPKEPPDVPPSYMVLLPNEDGTVGQISLQSRAGTQTLRRAKEGADVQGGGQAFGVNDRQLKRDFGAAMEARPTLPERFKIYYPSGDGQLSKEGLATFNAIIKRSQAFSALEVLIIGHTDTMGNPQANYELGMQRAKVLTDMLIDKGIRAVNIEVGSEGEASPAVPTPDKRPEPRNRRVEITLR